MASVTLQPACEPSWAPERSRDKPRRARSTRILLVEDEPLTAEVFAMALSRDGHLVEVARDGLQALRRLHDWRPTLVVLDMSLPALPGADLVRRVREGGQRNLPIVVVSGSPRAAADLTNAELWPGTWLEKPVKPRDLVDIVRDFTRDAG